MQISVGNGRPYGWAITVEEHAGITAETPAQFRALPKAAAVLAPVSPAG